MADTLNSIVVSSISAIDKVNTFILTVANADVFSSDSKDTQDKMRALVSKGLPKAIRVAIDSLQGLRMLIINSPFPRFKKAMQVTDILIKELLGRVRLDIDKFFDGESSRESLINLGKNLSQASVVIRRTIETT